MPVNKYSEDAQIRLKDFYRKKKRFLGSKGDILINPASKKKLEKVIYLEKGRVIEYDLNDRGEKVILNIFKEGAFFPMNYALAKTDVKYFFEADCDVVLREASVQETVQFLESNSVVMFDLMTRVSVGLDGLLNRLSLALKCELESKIIAELHLSAERFGYDENQDSSKTLHQELTVTRLSQQSGASREATSRSVQKLLNRDMIKRDGKVYTIN